MLTVKQVIDLFYTRVELVDITTNKVIVTYVPGYQQKIKEYWEQPVYCIIKSRNSIQIITEGLKNV